MKVAYVSQYDAQNVRAWSGTGFNMAKCLSGAGIDVAFVGPLNNQHHPLNIARYLVNTKLLKKNDHPQRDPGFLRYFSRQAEPQIRASGADVVFAPGGLPLSYLKSDLPVVLWTDCTFANLLDHYPTFSNLSARSIRNGHDAERRALHNCDLILFSSRWAANSAIYDYGVDPAKIHLVPLGSNMPDDRTEADVKEMIKRRVAAMALANKVVLFGSGVDWVRKGFDKAAEVVDGLNAQGINAELFVAGCKPPPGPLSKNVRLLGFIDKSKPEGIKRLSALYEMAHWFILPSRADCYGIVFCEAASYGLPSLATQTGGIGSAVTDGVNGFTFPLDAQAQQWIDQIVAIVRDPPQYAALCLSSYHEYQSKLNWAKSGQIIKGLLETVVVKGRRK